ncbi:KAP family P-loop domain-containing protein [Kosakonia arachidis]|uniref:KAP family P-loop domain-containing protein n=1 Tax=Kosakonia arachidis TaxID=551989 RepID=A0A1I6YRD5_9ENTR|nr:P-loop NTPase fold protein [Kosakonia arachidis]SFT53049.1 KAP family P-loop domain-containing protein [Kosakonia arachidis]
MDIKWEWNIHDEFFGEQLPVDTLDRQKYAKYLYEICAARGENANLVINLNAEWGAGKTYFTKRLAKTIAENHPTIYIDSWKEDFSDDPLLTVFSSIKEQLTGQSDQFTKMMNNTIDAIGPLLKSAAPAILGGLAKKYTGVENISDITKSLSQKLLELHSEKSKRIATIKKGISEWVRYIKQKDGINKALPLFVIIDELDRCRPSFAISLLEVTKHIFNIPGVVFIIATDTEQLQHSIKVIYGSNFSANLYLSRFFDRRFLLPSPKMANLIKTHTLKELSDGFNTKRNILVLVPPSLDDFIDNCTSILEAFEINLRDALKIYNSLMDYILIGTKKIDASLYLILSCIYMLNSEIYFSIKNNRDVKSSTFYDKEILLKYDLSSSMTGVNYFSNPDGLITNTLKNEKIKINIKNYITYNFRILEERNATSNPYNARYPLPWKTGGLRATFNDMDVLLKVGWADTKENNLGITQSQYFELIELSTTLDSDV